MLINSMNEKDKNNLKHIKDSCDAIKNFIVSKSRNDLDTDRMLISAIVRELEIVGEAAGALSEDFRKETSHIPWRAIIGMRNRLIHAYFDIDCDIVWNTINTDIPVLNKELNNVLRKL